MHFIKNCLGYIIVFVMTCTVLLGLLVGVAIIPQSAIKENVRQSAEYLHKGELFGQAVEGVNGSTIDRYADSILISIAYQYDSINPLKSVMWSSYYYTDTNNENENLYESVNNDYEANQQYMRYWHGSNTIVRPLLTVLTIKQIYILNGIVLVCLIIWLISLLIKKKLYTPAVGIVAGLILTSAWFVPLSLEYTWTFMVMLIMSIIAVMMVSNSSWKYMGVLFLIGGMVTNYLDFLTTETITLLVPLLLVLYIQFHNNKEELVITVKNIVSIIIMWGIGYAGMWVMKWILASFVIGESMLPYLTNNVAERLSGDIGIGITEYLTGAVANNIKCLFPYEYGITGIFAGIIVIVWIMYIIFVYRKKDICKSHVLIYLFLSFIPYIRYLVLHNHSYLHCFFTYRAQITVIVAVALIVGEVSEWRPGVRGKTGKKS